MARSTINILPVIIMILSGGYLLYSLSSDAERPLPTTEQAKQCTLINTVLQHAMEALSADRAYLFQFHNGTHVGNRQFIFYTNTHEVCAPGVSSEIMCLQRIPLSLLAPSWLPMMEKSKSFYRLVKDEPHTQTRLILEKQGIEAVAIARVMHLGEIIGFIGVDYVRSKPDTIDLKQLEEAGSIIQTLITGKHN